MQKKIFKSGKNRNLTLEGVKLFLKFVCDIIFFGQMCLRLGINTPLRVWG